MAGRLEQYNATLVRDLYGSDVQLWRVAEGDELAVIEGLNDDPAVAYAEPNFRYRAFVDPNDPGYGQQWAHTTIRSSAAWDITTGSADLIIAIIDSGIDSGHPDLASKIVSGYDFVDNDDIPHDLNGHGTHVAGIAAAATSNATGVAGTDWQARIMPVRVLDYAGQGYASDIAEGITWAYQHGAKVINLSLGGPSPSETMQNVINNAHAAGSLVIAAMGNCRDADPPFCPTANPTMYPAAYAHVMAVAATAPLDSYTFFSQYGDHCDIAAPGGEMSGYHDPDGIYSTMPTYPVYMTTVYNYYQGYDFVHGTSQAAPYVAGLAGLVWAADPTLTVDEVQSTIETTAVDLGPGGWDPDYGHGRIDARAAVALAAVPPAVVDLRVAHVLTDTGTLTVTLGWSAPSFAATSTLRYAQNPINTEVSWANAPILTDTLPGGAEAYTATIPFEGGIVYFAHRSQDEDGQWSTLSNSAFWPARYTYIPLILK
jgi:subtilisin family serine protease